MILVVDARLVDKLFDTYRIGKGIQFTNGMANGANEARRRLPERSRHGQPNCLSHLTV